MSAIRPGGPFLGETAAAKGLRLAFDLAVDKKGLATTVCHNLICSPATGGLITSGLVGNGGQQRPAREVRPDQAKPLLKQYDPTGTLTAHVVYSYDANSLNESTAEYLQNPVADEPRRPRHSQSGVEPFDLHQAPSRR